MASEVKLELIIQKINPKIDKSYYSRYNLIFKLSSLILIKRQLNITLWRSLLKSADVKFEMPKHFFNFHHTTVKVQL